VRIVSVLPSATELVAALGHEMDLVGRSAECDYPPSIRDRPVVMRPRTWDAEQPSAAIDDRVRHAVRAGESLYHLDLDELAALAPDLLLTQDLCRVCSVTDEEAVAACATAGVAPQILSLSPRSLAEVLASFRRVAEVLGAEAAAERLVARFALASQAAPDGPAVDGGSVAVVEWVDPPFVSGLWTPDLIAAAGGRAVGSRSGVAAARTSWRAIADLQPDLVVVSPCSFSVPRAQRDLQALPSESALHQLRPRHGIWVADEAYFSRPGPRLADGIALLRDLLRDRSPSRPMPVEPWSAPEPGR
jgi:iron complex transport system substrate-binding protein